MPRQIYNEGRVVGLSAYEIFIREYLSEGNKNPPSEREWLASTLAFGSSMLLKVPTVTPASGSEETAVTIDFPADSNLCAANTIIASFFNGDAKLSAAAAVSASTGATVGLAYWGEQVTDYGELISNTSTLSPSNTGSVVSYATVPSKSSLVWSDMLKSQLSDYLKVVDGIVIQSGVWSTVDSANQPPQKDLTPDMTKSPQVRLHIHGTITEPFWILLTGFTIRNVVVGESGLDGSIATDHPEDGDFLGPACFPWANKIVFSIPVAAISSMLGGSYTRSIALSETGVGQTDTVDDSAIIDLKFASDIYTTRWQDSLINYSVSELDKRGEGAAVLGIYPRIANWLRGLYASRITETGQAVMEPVDCHAPGTVKLYHHPNPGTSEDDLDILRAAATPNNRVLLLGSLTNVGGSSPGGRVYNEYVYPNLIVPIAATSVNESTATTVAGQSGQKKYTANIVTGEREIKVLSLVKYNSSTDKFELLPTAGSATPAYALASYNSGNLNWDILQYALGNNKSIDVLGNPLKQLRSALENISANKQYAIVYSGGSVGIEEVAALPNFFFISLDCDVTNYTSGANNIYEGIRFDLFGFSTNDASSTGLVNTFGTLTALQSGNYSFGGNAYNWFQPFKVKSSYQSQFDTLVTRLNPASVSNLNVIKINCMPVTNYRSQSGSVDNGAPITNTPNVWAAYMNATNGNSTYEEGNKYDGILYVRNSGSTQNASQVSVLCSMILYHSNNRPRCRRSNTAHSGYLAW